MDLKILGGDLYCKTSKPKKKQYRLLTNFYCFQPFLQGVFFTGPAQKSSKYGDGPTQQKKKNKFTEVLVLESYHYLNVIGGQVQIWWAGLAWHWSNAKPNLTIGTTYLVIIAKNAKPGLPI